MSIENQLLYEDKHIIVLSKLPGQLSQPDKRNSANLKDDLENYLIASGQRQKSPFIGLIHRLDRPVGGVMVYGKTKEGTASLNKQLQTDRFKKEYLAVVKGVPTPNKGTLENYLLKNQRLNQSKVVKEGTPNSKRATLDYSLLSTMHHPVLGDCSLVQIRLHTGRHHQIRVQFSNFGYPLVGDSKYGTKDGQPIGLWAYKLQLTIPFKNVTKTFEHPPQESPFSLFDLANLL
jgi:23S rRNA pseudouridine1911/1915/1917 synthase